MLWYAATAAKRNIEEGEVAAYEHSSDEDYDSLLELEGEDESLPDGILRGRARLHCVQPSTAGEDNERRKWGKSSTKIGGKRGFFRIPTEYGLEA